MKRFLLPFLLLLFVGVADSSAINTGYYRVKSNYGSYMTENLGTHALTCNDLNTNNYAQVWLLTISGSSVTLKNALTQRYIQGQGDLSSPYSTGTGSVNFGWKEVEGQYTFASDGVAAGLHCDASKNIVRWYVDNDYSKWTIESVAVDNDALTAAQAEYNLDLTTGYYRIKSNHYDNRYITENTSEQKLVTSGIGDSFSQIWYVQVDADEHTATIKNVLTDDYIQTQGTQSAQYSAGATAKAFVVAETKGSPNTYSFTDTGGRGLHCAVSQSYNVVSWNSSADASIWQLEAVEEPTAEAIETERSALAEASASQLTTFFTTTACTELRSTYQTMADEALRSAMSALPTTVQNMAIKVKNNSWTTYDGWDKTEKTFRIADYKAYSNGDRWTNIMGFGYHVGRIENPTGIYVEDGDYLQVYVGSIPAGESVKLAVAGYGAGGNGGTSIVTFTLHEGMNTMRMTNSGNCFVFYEVDNTTGGSAPYKLLSTYADVTVHIEGGTVQGYFDLTKGDDDADWTPLKTHLMTKEMFCLKTKSLVFNLQTDLLKHAVDEAEGGSRGQVVGMLEYWQQIQDMEDEIFNREAIATFDYCNNIHSVTTIGNNGDGALYAYTNGIYFSPEQHDRLFNYDLFRLGSDNLWAAAHELGHHRQAPINMVGNTEVSNNLYSNVAVYQQGRYTSRTAGIKDILEDYSNGLSYPERIVLANTDGYSGTYNQHMLMLNWQLYMFFHINGNDPDFFPKLFSALRSDPMTKTAGENTLTAASTDYLKYYVKCCEVSGYDLTDFFAAYGFFMLPPEKPTAINGQTRYTTIGDYGTFNLYVTQSMIDDAKAQVAAMSGLKSGSSIIFIEDKVRAPLANYDGHAEGETKAINAASLVRSYGVCGEMGQYTDFDEACSSYRFNVSSRGNVTVEGTGAVGIIVYDNSNNIIGFYNTKTFRLPASAFDENGLKSGYSIKAAVGDGTTATATYDASIEINEFPKVGVWYSFRTPLRGNRYTLSNGKGQGVVGATLTEAAPTNAMQWKFVERDGELATFDIINRNDNSYLSPAANSDTQINTSENKPAAGWKLKPANTAGMYIIYSGNVQLNQTNHEGSKGYKIYNWGNGSNTTDGGCQFAIEEVTEISSTALDELEGLDISVSGNPANDLTTGQWYVMFNRGRNGYLYEMTTHTLDNTSTVPSDACPYLVRLIEASNGKYYLQTGYGNYFWQFQHGTRVSTTPQKSEPVTIAKIGSTAGHFYLQNVNNNIVLDSNAHEGGVVGYGTDVPTSTGGNNDWAFYPVTFNCPVNLNAYGYATFAGNYAADYTDDSSFSAWMVKSVSGVEIVFQQIKEVAAPGTGVLLMGLPRASVSIPLTNQNDGTDFSNENLLVGITSPTLIASDTYYGLSGNNFVKVNAGKVPARKALLPASVVDGVNPVKALTFVFNSEDGIETMSNGQWTMDNVQIYNLAGQRLSKPQRGINIINGKKVLVK